jgi:hypothetical protein
MPRTANLSLRHGLRPLNAKETDLDVVKVASAYGTALYEGDPVLLVSDGTYARTPAGSAQAATTDGITAVITKIIQFQDAAGKLVRTGPMQYVPASTSYTSRANRTLIEVCYVTEDMRFAIKTDASVTSMAVADSLVGNNVDLAYTGGTDAALGLSGCQAIIGGAVTTTKQLRILGLRNIPFVDPTVGPFELVVKVALPVYLPIVGHAIAGV